MRGSRYLLMGVLPALLFSQSALADGNDQLVERFLTACPVSMTTADPIHAAAKRYSWRPLSPVELDAELRTNSEFLIDSYLPPVLRTIKDPKVADELAAKERDRQNARKVVGFTSRNEDIAALNFENIDSILWTRDLMCMVQTATAFDVVAVAAKVSERLGVQPTKWKPDDSWSWVVDPSNALAPTISLIADGRHYEGKIVLILQVVLVEGS